MLFEQQVLGKIRGILNKITLERFETLSTSLVDFIKSNFFLFSFLSVLEFSEQDCLKFL